MKRTLICSLLLATSAFFIGCESLDMVRANLVSLELNGTSFHSNPDTSAIIIPNQYEVRMYQYNEYFEFEINEALYSAKGKRCTIDLEFKGEGKPETGSRYPLITYYDVSDGEKTAASTFTYQGDEFEIMEGWIEFSEYGVNENKTLGCASGTFSLTLKDSSVKIAKGGFGRMLQFEYHEYL